MDIRVTFRRDLNQNVMILESSAFGADLYKLHMLEGNAIDGLLPVRIRRLNGECSLSYEITSLQNLTNLFEREGMDGECLSTLIREMNQTLQGVQQYLLDPEDVLLEPDYIYMDPDHQKIRLCYVPEYGAGRTDSLRKLADFVLKHLDHSDLRAVDMGYRFYDEAVEKGLLLSEIAARLTQKKEDPDPRREDAGPMRVPDEMSIPVDLSSEMGRRRGKTGKRNRSLLKGRLKTILAIAALSALFGFIVQIGNLDLSQTGGLAFLFLAVIWLVHNLKENRKRPYPSDDDAQEDESEEMPLAFDGDVSPAFRTEILPAYGSDPGKRTAGEEQTRYLNQEPLGKGWYFTSEDPSGCPDLRWEGSVCVIGKRRDQTDICIPREEVSRIHAKAELNQEGSYLTDLNSLNGTFVNGRRLEPNEKVRIYENDRIAFAGISFRVHML